MRAASALGLFFTLLFAAAAGHALAADRVPVPLIPKAKSGPCVRDPVWMRRNHMTLLLHKREEIVHEGLANSKDRLERCINCHASTTADGKPIPIDQPGQFCYNCHKYAGVKIDCFSCHSALPSKPLKDAPFHPALTRRIEMHHVPGAESLSPDTLKRVAGDTAP
ncbi:MAG: Hdr-like menaquinol oxidoreductase cytochrome c subunit [Gammaproteobacteria bacterium]|nr:Hdr-like menaquinol oxidoreductase cytochrome c subunit [Gammaproteobacteria bacterium]